MKIGVELLVITAEEAAALREALGQPQADLDTAIRQRDEARAEVERLRAENARLRAQVAEYFAEPATHPAEREE